MNTRWEGWRTVTNQLTLLMTAILATESRMLNQMPISCALSAIGRRTSQMNLSESILISKMLLAKAKNGASGKEDAKVEHLQNLLVQLEPSLNLLFMTELSHLLTFCSKAVLSV